MISLSSQRSILLIEENPHHLQAIADAFDTQDHALEITTINNSASALIFLQEQTRIPCVDLIILSLDLPTRQGYKFLQITKTDPRFRRIPIIVLSNSSDPHEIVATYALQGNCHIVKTQDSVQLTRIIRNIEAFWLGIVTLPHE